MNLIFLLQRDRWFIEHEGRWSPVQTTEAVDLALTALPLVCVNEYELSEQPLQYGRAEVVCEGAAAIGIQLIAPDGSIAVDESVKLDPLCLASLQWDKRPASDGWVETVARLHTDGIRRLVLQAYIPPMESSKGKNLHILNETTGEEKTIFIRRGAENKLAVLDNKVAGEHRLVISCDAEAANDSADVRSLGFVLLDKIVDL